MATARRRLSPVKQRHLDGRIAERGLYSSPAPAGTALAGEPVARSWEERAVDSGNSGNAPCHARCSPRAFARNGLKLVSAELHAAPLGADRRVEKIIALGTAVAVTTDRVAPDSGAARSALVGLALQLLLLSGHLVPLLTQVFLELLDLLGGLLLLWTNAARAAP